MSKGVMKVLMTIGAVLMAVMTLLAGFAILWRVLANLVPGINSASLFWANEAQQLMFHWVIVIGMIITYVKDSQLNITLFFDKFPGGVQLMMRRLFQLLNIVVFSIILIWGGKLTMTEIATKTPAMELSRGLFVYFPYVLLSLFVVIHQCYKLLTSFKPTAKEA